MSDDEGVREMSSVTRPSAAAGIQSKFRWQASQTADTGSDVSHVIHDLRTRLPEVEWHVWEWVFSWGLRGWRGGEFLGWKKKNFFNLWFSLLKWSLEGADGWADMMSSHASWRSWQICAFPHSFQIFKTETDRLKYGQTEQNRRKRKKWKMSKRE